MLFGGANRRWSLQMGCHVPRLRQAYYVQAVRSGTTPKSRVKVRKRYLVGVCCQGFSGFGMSFMFSRGVILALRKVD